MKILRWRMSCVRFIGNTEHDMREAFLSGAGEAGHPAAAWRRILNAWRANAAALDSSAGILFLYVSFVFIFHNVWSKLMQGGTGAGFQAYQLTWYMALTEILALGVFRLGLEIEREIRSGGFMLRLLRPLGPSRAYFLKGAVASSKTLWKLILTGCVAATALTGKFPFSVWGLVGWALLLAGALLLALLFQITIGFSGVWISSVRPFYYVWQKLLFVFGGLLVPLAMYPALMHDLAWWTPFSAMLYLPAAVALGIGPGFWQALAMQWAWIAVIGLLTWRIAGAALRKQLREGD